jgi:hypothetical protein
MSNKILGEGLDIFSVQSDDETTVDLEQQVEDIIAVNAGVDIFGDDDEEEEPEEVIESPDIINEDYQEGEEEDSEEPEEQGQELNETNLIPLLAMQLKKEGVFSEDFDVTANTTQQEIYEAYKESIEEDVINKLVYDFQQKLQEEGYTEDNLKLAKLLSTASQEDTKQLKVMATDRALSETPFGGVDDEKTISVVKEYLQRTNVGKSQKIVDRLLDTMMVDEEEFKEAFEESKEFFKKESQRIEEEQVNRDTLNRKAREEIIARNREVINTTISTGSVRGSKIPNVKKFTEGVTENTESVDIRGQRRVITKLGKFLLEFNQDPELQLWAFNQHLFSEEIKEKVSEEATNKAEIDLLKNFNVVKEKGISTKKTTKILPAKSGKTTYFKVSK